jgi:hypothetical protein
MKRRALLQLAALAGAAAVIPTGASSVRASSAGYGGPYWITIQAGWGWDPSLFCDPKGAPVNQGYLPSEIGAAGAIHHAPSAQNDAFFSKYAPRLCVINGIELAAHDPHAADRHFWTGSLMPGYPALGALLASALGEGLPMSFLSTGGFEETAGLVPRSCLSGAGPLDWESLKVKGPDAEPLFSSSTEARITQYRRERLKAKKGAALPPAIQRAVAAAEAAELSRPDVELWRQQWPASFSEDPTRAVVQLVLAAFKAKVAVSANFHWALKAAYTDDAQGENFVDWMNKFDIFMEEIQASGLDGSIILVASSSGGRTPMYLDDGMKGHWSVGSALLLGPGIPTNRVIGATDEHLRALPLDKDTLEPKEGGVRLTPAHLQKALRRLAGASDSAAAERFPLMAEDLPLFD